MAEEQCSVAFGCSWSEGWFSAGCVYDSLHTIKAGMGFDDTSLTSRCCRCTDSTHGWSASGSCSFCGGTRWTDRVAEVWLPPSGCQAEQDYFKGSQECAEACTTMFNTEL